MPPLGSVPSFCVTSLMVMLGGLLTVVGCVALLFAGAGLAVSLVAVAVLDRTVPPGWLCRRGRSEEGKGCGDATEGKCAESARDVAHRADGRSGVGPAGGGRE